MGSPNDITAEALDIAYAPYTNEELTRKEIDFIESISDKNKPILDIGCGTGRHMIPLLKSGYNVVGLDESKEMIRILKSKLDKGGLVAKTIQSDILSIEDLDEKFGSVIILWNGFPEMATTEDEALRILNLIFGSLDSGGKLIIEENIDPDNFDPKKNEFKSNVEHDGRIYDVSFVGVNYDERTNMTKSKETVMITENGKILNKLETACVLKWWKKDELDKLCRDIGFSKIEFLGSDFLPLRSPVEKLFLVATK